MVGMIDQIMEIQVLCFIADEEMYFGKQRFAEPEFT